MEKKPKLHVWISNTCCVMLFISDCWDLFVPFLLLLLISAIELLLKFSVLSNGKWSPVSFLETRFNCQWETFVWYRGKWGGKWKLSTLEILVGHDFLNNMLLIIQLQWCFSGTFWRILEPFQGRVAVFGSLNWDFPYSSIAKIPDSNLLCEDRKCK